MAASSVDDVEVRPAAELGRRRREDGSHRLRRAPLASDDFADVVFGHAKLDEQVVLAFDLGDFYGFGVIDQGFGDGLDQFFQRHAPPPLPPKCESEPKWPSRAL